jgi:hypothetical protein
MAAKSRKKHKNQTIFGFRIFIGYGDIVVKTSFGRIVAVLLGLIGVVFTGLMVAAALHAVGESMKGMKKS